MKKTLLLIAALFFSIASFAQTVSGTVLNTLGAPMTSHFVTISTDTSSGYNPILHGPGINITTTTNSTGAYSISIPGTTLTGHPIEVITADCRPSSAVPPNLLTNSHTYSGTNITSNFTTCVPPYITGTVTLGTGTTPAAGAKVFLIRKNIQWITIGSSYVVSWVLTMIDSTTTNSSGVYYCYNHWGSDSVMVKAFLPSGHANYSNYLPTYGTSSLLWSGAKCFPQPLTTTITNNIALQAGVNPGGAGFVGGAVVVGANKTTAVGDPVPNRQIILTDAADKPVAYTFSDNAGKFSFPALAYGSYKIFGDVAGKTSTPLSFTISAANPSVNLITFEEKALTFNASMPKLGVANTATQQHGIYPNPAKNIITITGLTADATVTIYDMTGRTLVQQAVNAANNTVNIAALATGNYVVKLATAQETTTIKLTKE